MSESAAKLAAADLGPSPNTNWRALDRLVRSALYGLAPDDAVFEDFGITRPQLRHLAEVAFSEAGARCTVPIDGPTMDAVCRRYEPFMSARECDQ